MSHDTIAFGNKKQHLSIPIVRRQRPAVVKNDGLRVLWPPVFVKQFNAVTGFHGLHILVSIVVRTTVRHLSARDRPQRTTAKRAADPAATPQESRRRLPVQQHPDSVLNARSNPILVMP
jgi:hypothetical protein